jgi:hypothetical protein
VAIQDEKGRTVNRIGEQSIRVCLKKSTIFFVNRLIYCDWAFSKNGDLIDIVIHNVDDGP